jgi:tetratricopeptide (TPR) repeat protein
MSNANSINSPLPSKPIGAWISEIHDANARGELLQAFDLAERALEEFPDDAVLRYNAVLALARAGATRQARTRYDRFKLGDLIAIRPADAFIVDIAAIDARIAKDEALQEIGADRNRLLAIAAARYEAIFRRTAAYYPGVNAATLTLLGGDLPRAESLAREVQNIFVDRHVGGSDEEYFARATEAEAALVLGDIDAARCALRAAALASGRDYSSIATTRRQLKLVCAARGIATDLLEAISAPSVIHYSGHLPGPRFPQASESGVRDQIAAALQRHDVGFGYGSLAAGADILFAEELLRKGAELNLTMPFGLEEFKRVSVAPAGESWLPRFDSCYSAAKSVTYATTDLYFGEEGLFAYASEMAMGLARLHARFLDTVASQIVVWDGVPARERRGIVGTAADVYRWRKLGLPGEVIRPAPDRKTANSGSPAPRQMTRKPGDRSIRAMLFGDIKWFSRLSEPQMPIFTREVIGLFARVLGRHGRKILFRNTWGDGLSVTIADVETAASVAIELQEALAAFDFKLVGLPELALRLGTHFGPVYRLRDPVLKRMCFTGVHVCRAARIEPITPEGSVYATEAFAAALATTPDVKFTCEYVGQVPGAKNYGVMRIYSLRRWGNG